MQIMPSTYTDTEMSQSSHNSMDYSQDPSQATFSKDLNDALSTEKEPHDGIYERASIAEEPSEDSESPYTGTTEVFSLFVPQPVRFTPAELDSLSKSLMTDGVSADAINAIKNLMGQVGGPTVDELLASVKQSMQGGNVALTEKEVGLLQALSNRISPNNPDKLYNSLRYETGTKGIDALSKALTSMDASLSKEEVAAIGKALNLSADAIAGLNQKMNNLEGKSLSTKDVNNLFGDAKAEIKSQSDAYTKMQSSLEKNLKPLIQSAESREELARQAQMRESRSVLQSRIIIEDTVVTRVMGDDLNRSDIQDDKKSEKSRNENQSTNVKSTVVREDGTVITQNQKVQSKDSKVASQSAATTEAVVETKLAGGVVSTDNQKNMQSNQVVNAKDTPVREDGKLSTAQKAQLAESQIRDDGSLVYQADKTQNASSVGDDGKLTSQVQKVQNTQNSGSRAGEDVVNTRQNIQNTENKKNTESKPSQNRTFSEDVVITKVVSNAGSNTASNAVEDSKNNKSENNKSEKSVQDKPVLNTKTASVIEDKNKSANVNTAEALVEKAVQSPVEDSVKKSPFVQTAQGSQASKNSQDSDSSKLNDEIFDENMSNSAFLDKKIEDNNFKNTQDNLNGRGDKDTLNDEQGKKGSDSLKFEHAFASVAQSHSTPTTTPATTNAAANANAFSFENTARYMSEVRDQVQNSMLNMAKNGAQRIEISLNPVELGQLNIALSIKNGEISATIQAEKSESASMINMQIDAIRAELENQGFKVSKIDVEVGLSQDDRQEWQGMEQHNSSRENNENSKYLERLRSINKLGASENRTLAHNMQHNGSMAGHTANNAMTGLHIIA